MPLDASGRAAREKRWKAERAAQLRRAGVGVTDIARPGPTPETKAKLRPDPVVELHRRRKLETCHLLAAANIRDVFEALTRPLWARTMDYEPPIGSRTRPLYRAPIERIPEHLWVHYQERYAPWADEVQRWDLAVPAGRMTALELTVSIVVDGHSLNAMVGRMRMRRKEGLRFATDVLRKSLTRYCDFAGLN